MEYTIKDVYEKGSCLVVEVEHIYGEEKIGLGLGASKLNPETDEPRWLQEVEKLMEKKYGTENKIKKKVFQTYVGNKYGKK